MGSIRPLITITILVVVGAYLYVKINEGPVPSHAGAAANWSQTPEGVPPLAGTKGASLATESAAPAWPSTATTTAPAAATAPNAATASATGNAPSATANAKGDFPAVPAIPELPAIPAATDIALPAGQPSSSAPKDLPANIPTARYPDAIGQSPSTATAKGTSPIDDPLGLAAQPAATSNAPQQPAPAGVGSTSAPLSPQASAQNPLRPSPEPVTPAGLAPDRYSASAATQPLPSSAAPNQPIAPVETPFTASWPAIQSALDRGDLKQAHQLLSKWHGNESLSPTDTAKVESLLGQLAGTVIYSNEHRLEPARVVKPGETLETIAKEYNVPSQLLAKINGIQTPDQIRPGQELKVVRGPFSAVVELRRNELTLMVDDRYAGKFRVSVPPGTALTDGQWLVDQKLAGPTSTASLSAYATTPIAADRTIVLRSATAAAAVGAPTLIIGSGPSPTGVAANLPSLRVSPQDAEEISDILSVGSRVIVRR